MKEQKNDDKKGIKSHVTTSVFKTSIQVGLIN